MTDGVDPAMTLPEWTPPIFGWQYRFLWVVNGDDITGSTYDWMHWYRSKYVIWVTGAKFGSEPFGWTASFNVPSPCVNVRSTNLRVRLIEQGRNLPKVIRALERKVRALGGAVQALSRDEGTV